MVSFFKNSFYLKMTDSLFIITHFTGVILSKNFLKRQSLNNNVQYNFKKRKKIPL